MFYLTLPSNSSQEYFPDNTLTHYFTKLPQAIDLKGVDWEVGLVEMQYPHTWYNIQEDEGWVDIRTEADGVVHHSVLSVGLYQTL